MFYYRIDLQERKEAGKEILKQEKRLLEQLREYGKSDMYPFHMPGHKRAVLDFPNPYQIDITEIDGFDNLHHPEGILKEAMKYASEIYRSDKSWFLVNGSSSGILSAVCGMTKPDGWILMSRNCHKSVYHGVFQNRLHSEYIYPQYSSEFGIQGGILPEDVENSLKSNPEIQAVLIVSPTYEGMVSDIEKIAEIVHKFGIPLIVDEAHGAHFPFACKGGYPVSALDLGADAVIQSLHKTLPSFTQTGIMHWRAGYSDCDKIERYLQIYQSSSPSYIFMGGMDLCIRTMAEDQGNRLDDLLDWVSDFRRQSEKFEHIRIPGRELIGIHGIYDLDPSKLILSVKGTDMTGEKLAEILRKEYHLEMEMSGTDYVLAMTSPFDRKEGLDRLYKALEQIDVRICKAEPEELYQEPAAWKKQGEMTIFEAWNQSTKSTPIRESEGEISGEFVYIYPPGIPVIAPGERISREMLNTVIKYKEHCLPVQGMKDPAAEYIETVIGE